MSKREPHSGPPVPRVDPIPPGYEEVRPFSSFSSSGSILLVVPSKAWKAYKEEEEARKRKLKDDDLVAQILSNAHTRDTKPEDGLVDNAAAILEAKLEAEEAAAKQTERIARLQKQAKDLDNLAKGIDPVTADLLEADQLPVSPRHHLQVYEPLAPLVLGQKTKTTDRDVSTRNKDLLKTLTALGSYRRIVDGPADLSFLDDLLESHPHFAAVTEFVRGQLTMIRQMGKPIHIPPIMLGGGPGLGKTHFAQALAKAIGIPCRRQGMDSAVTGSAITGSDKKWANTTTGFLFDRKRSINHAYRRRMNSGMLVSM